MHGQTELDKHGGNAMNHSFCYLYGRATILWAAKSPAIRYFISALVGSVIGSWITYRWQLRQWKLNSRKEEWRELIGTLTRCAQQIVVAMSTALSTFAARAEVSEAQLEGSRVIRDRLFITSVLGTERIQDRWIEIEKLANSAIPHEAVVDPPFKGPVFSVTQFQSKWSALHAKLVALAQKDLGIDGHTTTRDTSP